MSEPQPDLLTTTEGVDEGSARSTVESGPDGQGPVASDDGTPGRTAVTGTGADQPPAGTTPDEQDAPPLDMESADSRAARVEHGTGQQLSAGEGSAP